MKISMMNSANNKIKIMKKILKKAFSIKSLEPFMVGIGVILLLEFAIFPALTIANTFLNLLGGGLGVGLAIFLYQYIKAKVTDKEEDVIEDAETELDYINPSEIKTKRKPVIKKSK